MARRPPDITLAARRLIWGELARAAARRPQSKDDRQLAEGLSDYLLSVRLSSTGEEVSAAYAKLGAALGAASGQRVLASLQLEVMRTLREGGELFGWAVGS